MSGLLLELADATHASAFTNTWVGWWTLKKARDPAWTYRLFPWDRIILELGGTFAAVDQQGALEGLICTAPVENEMKVYFLSTAPWNHGAERNRRGVGAALISVAAEFSVAAGFKGQLVLSSTPESESFYNKLGFSKTGEQDHEGLNVFRLSADRATKHLEHYPALPFQPKPQPQPQQSGGTP